MDTRHALITNLAYVVVSGVRTHTNALLIVREQHPLDRGAQRCLLRGFGTTATWPTFDLVVPSDEFELVPAASGEVLVSEGDGVRPLYRGAILRITGAADVQLIADVNSSQPIDVHRFDRGTPIEKVWRALDDKVMTYWSAPYFPVMHFLSTRDVRESARASARSVAASPRRTP